MVPQKYLEKTFQEHDFDTDEEVSYTQWESTDRTTSQTLTASIEDFIESLVSKLTISQHIHSLLGVNRNI